MLKLKKEKKEEIYQFFINRFNRIKAIRDIYDLKVKDWVLSFNSIPEITESVLSNIVVPYIWTQVNTIKPRVAASIFSTAEFIDIKAKLQEYQKSETKIRDYILFKLEEHDFREKMRLGINLALIYPCSWTKVVLTKDNDPLTTNLDFFDVWCSYTWQNGKSDIFHRIETNKHNLKYYEKKKIYENIDDIPEGVIDKEIPQLQAQIISYFLGISDEVVLDDKDYSEKGALGKVELVECWGKYDTRDDGILRDIIVSFANRQTGIRIDENLYDGQQPFFPVRIIRNPGIVYGKPVAQVLESQQDELNTIRRQRIDFNNLILKPPFKAVRTADLDWGDIFAAPDKILKVDDKDDLTPMQFPMQPQTSYMEENLMKNDAQLAVGGTDPLQGMSPGGRQTATGLTILTNEGSTRMKDYVFDVAEDITKLLRFVVYVLKRFKKETATIKRLNTQEWEDVTVEEIEGNYAVDIQITNIQTNKELRLQLLMNTMNMMSKVPGVNLQEFARQILKEAEIKNPETIIPKTKEVSTQIADQRNMEAEAKQASNSAPEGSGNLLDNNMPNIVENPILAAMRNLGGS